MKVYFKKLFDNKYIGYNTFGLSIKDCTYERQSTSGNEPSPISEKDLED